MRFVVALLLCALTFTACGVEPSASHAMDATVDAGTDGPELLTAGPDPYCGGTSGFPVPQQVNRCFPVNRPDLASCFYHHPSWPGARWDQVAGCRVFTCYVKPGGFFPTCDYTDCVWSCSG